MACEGTQPDSSLHVVFLSKQRKGSYKEKFCCCRWKQCLIAKMLNRMYDYDP